MTRLNTIQLAALSYLERDWSVLPIGNDKRPLGSWRQWMKEPMSASEAEILFRHAPGVGIVCGSVSGLMVLDFDGQPGRRAHEELRAALEDCGSPGVITGSNGRHHYFLHETGQGVSAWRWQGQRAGELRGDGGYVVAPPSLHPSGRRYRWLQDIPSALPALPDSLRARLLPPAEPTPTTKLVAACSLREAEIESALLADAVAHSLGARNDEGFRLARRLRDCGISESEARRVLAEYAQRVSHNGKHPYTTREAIGSVRQAFRRSRHPLDRDPLTAWERSLNGAKR